MLVLTRLPGEAIYVNEDDSVKVTVVSVDGQKVRIGIDAPRDVNIRREELPPRPRIKPPARPD